MVPKERLQSSHVWLLLFLVTLLTTGSGHTRIAGKAPDDDRIPGDTIMQGSRMMTIDNGIVLLNNLPFSGIVTTLYAGGGIQSYRSVLHGKLHGLYKSFYADGSPFEVRMYRNDLASGRHYGYWPGGKQLKFDYHYADEKKQGPQKKWYMSGQPYLFTNYANDREEGLQQGWRENGKLFLNYVAKDGHTYGLQQTALCYSLINENIRSTKALK